MGISETVEKQLKQARNAVYRALLQAEMFAQNEIVQSLQEAVDKLDAVNSRADGAMDRFLHGLEQSRYTALVVTGAALAVFVVGAGFGWALTVAFV